MKVAPLKGAMGEEVLKRLGNDTSMAHEIQVLKQMTAEGKIAHHSLIPDIVSSHRLEENSN